MANKCFNIFVIATIGRTSLNKSIQSVLDQDNKCNNKIVVVFDNIPINRVIDDNRIIYIKTPKKLHGAGARNYGINYIETNNINSTFISFLDDDDYITEDYGKQLYAHRKWDMVVHSIYFPWHPKSRQILPAKEGKGISRGSVGVAISIKLKKLLNKKIKYRNIKAADFFFITDLTKSGLTHYKTGKVTYVAPQRGNTSKKLPNGK